MNKTDSLNATMQQSDSPNATNTTEYFMYKLVASSSVAVLGILLNSCSLSYYVVSVRSSQKGLTRLVMQLNIYDLAVCISAAFVQVFYQSMSSFKEGARGYQAVYFMMTLSITLYRVATLATAGMTCILSTTRSLSLCRPFYRPNFAVIVTSLMLVVVVMAASNIAFLAIYFAEPGLREKMQIFSVITLKIETTAILLTVIIVALFNVITIVKMCQKVRSSAECSWLEKGKKCDFVHATVTVIILSGIFCVLNMFYLILIFESCVSRKLKQTNCSPDTLLVWFGMWQALPINSCLNPLVYFARSENMREYLKQKVLICCCPRCAPHATNGQMVTLTNFDRIPTKDSQLTAASTKPFVRGPSRRKVALPSATAKTTSLCDSI